MRLGGRRLAELRRHGAGARGRVLEIGCGTGLSFASYDWQHIERLDACEPDPFMLARARRKADDLPEEIRAKLVLHADPAERLPFQAETFDAAVSMFVLCSVHDLAAACAELARVLKPGACLWLVEHVRGRGARLAAQQALQPLWGWAAAGCHLNRDTVAALAAAGLEVRVDERFSLSPLLPAVRAVACKAA